MQFELWETTIAPSKKPFLVVIFFLLLYMKFNFSAAAYPEAESLLYLFGNIRRLLSLSGRWPSGVQIRYVNGVKWK
jgi:hypothetical protein